MMAYMFECKTELDFDWSLHAKTKSVQFTHEQTLVKNTSILPMLQRGLYKTNI